VVLSIPNHSLGQDEIQAALHKLLQDEQPVPETEIRHVCQGPGNCAVAAVAMLGGVSYEDVTVDRRAQGKMRVRKLLALLERFTRVRWQLVPLHSLPRRLDRIRFPDWPVIVYLRPAWKFRLIHCIVVKGEFVHDPNGRQAVRPDQYAKGHWRVCLIVQPATPWHQRNPPNGPACQSHG